MEFDPFLIAFWFKSLNKNSPTTASFVLFNLKKKLPAMILVWLKTSVFILFFKTLISSNRLCGVWNPRFYLANINETRKIYLSFVWSRVLFLSSFTVVVDLSKSTTCLHFHSLNLFQILVSKMFPYKSITLNHSLSELIIF